MSDGSPPGAGEAASSTHPPPRRSVACQTDWTDRCHERAAADGGATAGEAARREAPTPPPPPPPTTTTTPTPGSEAPTPPRPLAARCPICGAAWDANAPRRFVVCCCVDVCVACARTLPATACPLCGAAPPASREAGLATLRSRAAAGNAAALFHLGAYTARGHLVERDVAAAAALYERAAALGEVRAMLNLGVLRERAGDVAGAAACYRRAGDFPNAQFCLAGLLERDAPRAALKLVGAAALAGYAPAANKLGCLHAGAAGVPRDYGAALRWLARAEAAGSRTAAANRAALLARIYERARRPPPTPPREPPSRS